MDAELLLLVAVMSIVGSGLGTFTGLVPGIHVNTLAAMMVSIYPIMHSSLSDLFSAQYVPILVTSCIISAAVVHSFTDFVPSVFLGVPDPDEVMNLLPGHRMLLEGDGMAAVRAAAIGSTIGTLAAMAASIPLQFLMTAGLGGYLESITAAVLLIVVVILVSKEKGSKMIWAATMIILSGSLGFICMRFSGELGIIPGGDLLFPLLTGLFGMPAILSSMNNGDIPEQKDDLTDPIEAGPGLKGAITGGIVGWFPGITSTAGAVLASVSTPENDAKGFISLVASIGSAAAVFSIVTLSITGSGRSGASVAIREIVGTSISGIGSPVFLLILLSIAMATAIGYYVTIRSGMMMSSLMIGRDMRKVNVIVAASITILVMLMTGHYGLIVLITATILGLIPISVGVSRVHLSGCLILPAVILTLAGI